MQYRYRTVGDVVTCALVDDAGEIILKSGKLYLDQGATAAQALANLRKWIRTPDGQRDDELAQRSTQLKHHSLRDILVHKFYGKPLHTPYNYPEDFL